MMDILTKSTISPKDKVVYYLKSNQKNPYINKVKN